MVRVRLSLRERRWSFSACGKNAHRAQSLGRGHWLQPLGSIYENDLTHSNAANVAGSRSLQAPCDRTVDFTHILRNQRFWIGEASTNCLILAGKNQNQLRLSGNRIPPHGMRTQLDQHKIHRVLHNVSGNLGYRLHLQPPQYIGPSESHSRNHSDRAQRWDQWRLPCAQVQGTPYPQQRAAAMKR
jgi:hypothetical protein